MTYSICATQDGVHGVAIATKAPAVGSLAPFLSPNGVVSTQSLVSVPLGVKATRLMDEGASVDDAVGTLVAKDEDAAVRQVHGVDRWGNTVTFSGDDCVDWYGSRERDDFTVAGNMLVGERVVDAVATAFADTDPERPLAERLLAALRAGEEAGGDKRGDHAQSAALKVYHPETPALQDDLRVDDHEDPVSELERIYDVAKADNEEWQAEFPEAVLQRTLE
ncbi:DUF1028 domain-containing protein [Haloplanus halophilus]|uniref:DUF1028 domain-containing protein n=1 Tax=Haloplanus halophilus TaxID=2949993 RepID=UPI00203BE4D1|nr:DUF1028 domain-containing protein [Haloplanus sp. GDY1]